MKKNNTFKLIKVMNRCLICNRDLGDQNPRQFCRKTHCEYQDEYNEQEQLIYEQIKKELSAPHIENDWGMFKRKGCVKVDDIIQACHNFEEASPKLRDLSRKYGYGEVLDEIVVSKIHFFYLTLEENVSKHMVKNPLFAN